MASVLLCRCHCQRVPSRTVLVRKEIQQNWKDVQRSTLTAFRHIPNKKLPLDTGHEQGRSFNHWSSSALPYFCSHNGHVLSGIGGNSPELSESESWPSPSISHSCSDLDNAPFANDAMAQTRKPKAYRTTKARRSQWRTQAILSTPRKFKFKPITL